MTARNRLQPDDEAFARLQALFGVRIDEGVRQATRLYLDLLGKWSRAINLTGRLSPEELLERCFFESFWAAQALPAGAAVADVGSGAGFPGLAMALYRSDLRATLIEPNLKKGVFLKEVARKLGLEVTIHGGRGEDYPGWPQTGFALMRALKPSPELLSILREEGVTLLLLHGRETVAGLDHFRLLESRVQPGSRERRLSLFAGGECFT